MHDRAPWHSSVHAARDVTAYRLASVYKLLPLGGVGSNQPQAPGQPCEHQSVCYQETDSNWKEKVKCLTLRESEVGFAFGFF